MKLKQLLASKICARLRITLTQHKGPNRESRQIVLSACSGGQRYIMYGISQKAVVSFTITGRLICMPTRARSRSKLFESQIDRLLRSCASVVMFVNIIGYYWLTLQILPIVF